MLRTISAQRGSAATESLVLLIAVAVAGLGAWGTLGDGFEATLTGNATSSVDPAPQGRDRTVPAVRTTAQAALGALKPLAQRLRALRSLEAFDHALAELAPPMQRGLREEVSHQLLTRALRSHQPNAPTQVHAVAIHHALEATAAGDPYWLDAVLREPGNRGFAYDVDALDDVLHTARRLWDRLAARRPTHAPYAWSPALHRLALPALRFMDETLTLRAPKHTHYLEQWGEDPRTRAIVERARARDTQLQRDLRRARRIPALTWSDWWELSARYAVTLQAGRDGDDLRSIADAARRAGPFLPVPSDTAAYYPYEKIWTWRDDLFVAEIPATRKTFASFPADPALFYRHDLGHIERTRAHMRLVQKSGFLPTLERRLSALTTEDPALAQGLQKEIGHYLWEGDIDLVPPDSPRAPAVARLREWSTAPPD